jgi:prepilin-type N-terminal cleavage/methylation domain-containing protein
MTSNYNSGNRQNGFTLMELLVVIAIVGLLGSIIFAVTRGGNEQARIAKGLYFSQHLRNSLGAYAVGIWNFDEGSGSVAEDMSGWENHGTIYGATYVTDTPSGTGYALSFNGSGNYVDAGNDASFNITDRITLEAWVKPNFTSGNRQVIAKAYWTGGEGAINSSYQLRIDNGQYPQLYLSFNSTSETNVTYQNSFAVAHGNWYHIVGTYDGAKAYLYVNGSLIVERDRTGSINVSATNVNIGRKYPSTDSFIGFIDDARIYNQALTSAQIQSKYYAGLENLFARGLMDETEYQKRLALK